ncbi:hypothetical protein CI102_4696 [Trichoderma harzianum]|nr:hypothetical protein CI102_4696 [Trichoderma harzianum]
MGSAYMAIQRQRVKTAVGKSDSDSPPARPPASLVASCAIPRHSSGALLIASPTRTTTRSSRQQTNLWLVTIPSRPLMPRLARHSRAGSDGTPQKPDSFASASALLVFVLFLLLASALLDEPSIALQPLGAKLPLHFNLRVVRAPFTYLTMAFAVVARELSCFAHRLLCPHHVLVVTRLS